MMPFPAWRATAPQCCLPAPPLLLLLLCLVVGPITSEDRVMHLVDVPDLSCNLRAETSVQFDAIKEEPNREDDLYALTFYRTSAQGPTKITFSLEDRNGSLLVALTTVDLHIASRRLNDGQRETCEDFFLLDGRLPVDLPDTWGEARAAFRGICQSEGGGHPEECVEAEGMIFDGFEPNAEAPFTSDLSFCKRLWQHILDVAGRGGVDQSGDLTVGPRRLKSTGRGSTPVYHTRSGKLGAGRNFANPMFPSRRLGFTAAYVAAAYPHGYARPTYGYSGRPRGPPGQDCEDDDRDCEEGEEEEEEEEEEEVEEVDDEAAGSLPFWSVRLPNYTHQSSRSASHCHDDSSQTCVGGEVPCDSSGICQWYPAPADMLTRDDVMIASFQASGNFPMTLKVLSVEGPAYEATRICNPSAGIAWQPPSGQDVFVVLTKVVELNLQEGNTFLILVGAAGILVACICCICIVQKQKGNI